MEFATLIVAVLTAFATAMPVVLTLWWKISATQREEATKRHDTDMRVASLERFKERYYNEKWDSWRTAIDLQVEQLIARNKEMCDKMDKILLILQPDGMR